jgi:hypothetical protein
MQTPLQRAIAEQASVKLIQCVFNSHSLFPKKGLAIALGWCGERAGVTAKRTAWTQAGEHRRRHCVPSRYVPSNWQGSVGNLQGQLQSTQHRHRLAWSGADLAYRSHWAHPVVAPWRIHACCGVCACCQPGWHQNCCQRRRAASCTLVPYNPWPYSHLVLVGLLSWCWHCTWRS